MAQTLKLPQLRGTVSPEEWQARVDLAAGYRLVALFGWDDLIYTHISLRVPDAPDEFLINPFGLCFEEITASSLVKVGHDGRPLSETPFDINPAGFVIHSAVHEGRADVNCVLHTHTPHGIAVASQAEGLRPISQPAAVVLPRLAYHDYEGLALRDAEKARLVANLGSCNLMILRNHGLLACGRSVAEAFHGMYSLEAACRIQILAQHGGRLLEVPEAIIDSMPQQARDATLGQGAALAWPALLRRLDRRLPGYED